MLIKAATRLAVAMLYGLYQVIVMYLLMMEACRAVNLAKSQETASGAKCTVAGQILN